MPAKKKPITSSATRRKKKTPSTRPKVARPEDGAQADYKVRVRMYRHGLGDCLLLTFPGSPPSHLLVDCGTLGSSEGVQMADVLEDIRKEVGQGGALRAVVATHEHQDHVSGFVAAEKLGLSANEVWLAWTEDPADEDAKRLQKYEGDLFHAVQNVSNFMSRTAAGQQGHPLQPMATAVGNVLGFYGGGEALGASGKLKPRTGAGMDAATRMGKRKVFLSPGDVLQRDWAPGVSFHVLGPPRDEKYLKKLGEHGSADLYELAGGLAEDVLQAAPVFAAADDPGDCTEIEDRRPFDVRHCLDASDPSVRARFATAYDHDDDAWRRIDFDWLGSTADFAMQLDNLTNNTSLVLALEVDGKVLLLAADAQLGNWLSWGEVSFPDPQDDKAPRVTAADLLRKTVFYKVGHHSSHNATATAQGLELMERDDLVAFVPLDGEVAKKKKWPMPAEGLYRRLMEKTSGRVIRSDLGWPARPAEVREAVWTRLQAEAGVELSDLYVDYLLR